MKTTRKIKTFEATDNVDAMIIEAQKAGVPLVEFANETFLSYGKRVLAKLVNKRIEALRKVAARPFNTPDPQQGGMQLAA